MEIDVKEILEKSIINQKLVITLPWIVQFIAMLDPVTLNLIYYRQVFEILYELYMMTINYPDAPKLALRPTSLFIVRSCLGWLFEQPHIPNEYYNYRRNRKPTGLSSITQNEFSKVETHVPPSIASFFKREQHVVLNAKDLSTGNQNSKSGTIEKYSTSITNYICNDSQINLEAAELSECCLSTFDPLLENVLTSACPFLADFRVSIMPKRNPKTVSRTGRYRHVTTRIYKKTDKNAKKISTTDENVQTSLIEAFLHSQSLSVRRTVEFVLEKTFSNVIKDFQVQIIIPLKKSVTHEIENLRLSDKQKALNEVARIFTEGEKTLLRKWDEFIESMAKERIQVTLK